MWKWFIPPIYGEIGDGLLLFYKIYNTLQPIWRVLLERKMREDDGSPTMMEYDGMGVTMGNLFQINHGECART